MKGTCTGCDTQTIIQNKKYGLCGECVYRKNHGGKSRQEVQMEKQQQKKYNKGFVAHIIESHRTPPPIKKLTQSNLQDALNICSGHFSVDEEAQKNIQNQNIAEQKAIEEEGVNRFLIGNNTSIVTIDSPILNKFKKRVGIKRSKPKQVSKKQKDFNLQLSQLKIQIEQDFLSENKYFCTGCGKGQSGLDKSHIISIKNRKDLALERKNITLHCRSCHKNWESGNISLMFSLLDFDKNLRYIQNVDLNYYRLLLSKIKEEYTQVIYQIRNLVTKDIYIGSTIDFLKRRRTHLNHLRQGKHHSIKLQNSFNKYGEEEFKFEILEKIYDNDLLIEREQYYLDTLQPHYNMNLEAGMFPIQTVEDKIKWLKSVEKKIYQINFSLEIIAEWDSAAAAARGLGINFSSAISEVCVGTKDSYLGYIWQYQEGFDIEKLRINQKLKQVQIQARQIKQFSLDGVLLKVWENNIIASKILNINSSDISGACNGRLKTAGGFYWRKFFDISIPKI